jgi:hypothetical protein
VASAAMMAGTAAASPRIRRGDDLGSALETKGRGLLVNLTALTAGTPNPNVWVENNLFEIILAALAMVLKNGHRGTPFFLNITKENSKSKADP